MEGPFCAFGEPLPQAVAIQLRLLAARLESETRTVRSGDIDPSL